MQILRLIRRDLSSPSRPLLSFLASALPRWCPPALERRVFPMMVSNPPRVSRFPCEHGNMSTMRQVQGDESGEQYSKPPITSADVENRNSLVTQAMNNVEMIGIISGIVAGDERSDKDACRTSSEVMYVERDNGGQVLKHNGCEEDEKSGIEDQCGEIVVPDDKDYIMVKSFPGSRHRDGSIYRDMDTWWKRTFHIADRNETQFEAMTLSDPTDCILHNGTCMTHCPGCMLQILSLEVANLYVDGGLAEMYGYIAVRDAVDPLLNYLVNFSREDPVIVEQGCLINMVGPKRAINFWDMALIEYDMRIKIGEHENDDLQLIDGASIIYSIDQRSDPYKICIPGDCGTFVLTLSRLEHAAEATVVVLISEVQSSFNLSLSCLTSGLNMEIRLFDGAIAESRGLKRSVIAVLIDSLIDLKFEVGALPSRSERHHCSFEAKIHGHDTQEIKTHFALISVKVTWSTLPLAY